MFIIPSFVERNNDGLDHFLWKYNCEGQNEGNNGGNMMYDYGLDHREVGESFLMLTLCTFNWNIHSYTKVRDLIII